jgi:hypothetical protein
VHGDERRQVPHTWLEHKQEPVLHRKQELGDTLEHTQVLERHRLEQEQHRPEHTDRTSAYTTRASATMACTASAS